MVTIETIATVMKDGTITAQVPGMVLRGRHRVVFVLDETSLEKESLPIRRGFPDMAPFRETWESPPRRATPFWRCARKSELDLHEYLAAAACLRTGGEQRGGQRCFEGSRGVPGRRLGCRRVSRRSVCPGALSQEFAV